jgi:Flp pilus assembly protein TadG
MRNFKSFLANKSGTTAVIFSLTLVPVLGLAGAAVDYAQAHKVKSHLQDAVDAAALVAAKEMFSTNNPNQLRGVAESFFNENWDMPFPATITNFQVNRNGGNGGTVTIQARSTSPVTLTKILGANDIDIIADSQASNQTNGVEIVMVFDTTVSMIPRLKRAQDAVRSMLEQLQAQSGRNNFFITFVPMSDRINVGLARTGFMTGPVPAGWNGCYEPREETISGRPHELTDASPLDVPFLPSIPANYISPNPGTKDCPQPLTGPTANVNEILTALNGVTTGHTGRFDEGFAWGYRLLSPEWKGEWNGDASYPSNYGNNRKILVFLADGHTTIYEEEVGGASSSSFGWNNGTREAFENLVRTCQRAVDDEIEVWALFSEGNRHFETYMQQCASSPSTYRNVTDDADLRSAFENIASTEGSVRLVM